MLVFLFMIEEEILKENNNLLKEIKPILDILSNFEFDALLLDDIELNLYEKVQRRSVIIRLYCEGKITEVNDTVLLDDCIWYKNNPADKYGVLPTKKRHYTYIAYLILKLKGCYSKSKHDEVFNVKYDASREFNPLTGTPKAHRKLTSIEFREYDVVSAYPSFLYSSIGKVLPCDLYLKAIEVGLCKTREEGKKYINSRVNWNISMGVTYEKWIKELTPIFEDDTTSIFTEAIFKSKGEMYRRLSAIEKMKIEEFVKVNKISNYIRLHDAVIVGRFGSVIHTGIDGANFECSKNVAPANKPVYIDIKGKYIGETMNALYKDCFLCKSITGTGGTTTAIKQKGDTIILMPTVISVKNKDTPKNSNCLFVIAGISSEHINSYIFNQRLQGEQCKIIGTFDSLSKMGKASKLMESDFDLVIDEAQHLFSSACYRYKALSIILHNYKKFKSYCFLSADNIDLSVFDEFAGIKNIVLNWVDLPKKRDVVLYEIEKNIDRHVVTELYHSEGTQLIFFNSVKGILNIANMLMSLGIHRNEINIVCSNNKDNYDKVVKIGSITDRCRFNFYTSVAFESFDYYTQGESVDVRLVMNHLKHTKISLDSMIQIMGRVRDNIPKLHIYYKQGEVRTSLEAILTKEKMYESYDAAVQQTSRLSINDIMTDSYLSDSVIKIEDDGSLTLRRNNFLLHGTLHQYNSIYRTWTSDLLGTIRTIGMLEVDFAKGDEIQVMDGMENIKNENLLKRYFVRNGSLNIDGFKDGEFVSFMFNNLEAHQFAVENDLKVGICKEYYILHKDEHIYSKIKKLLKLGINTKYTKEELEGKVDHVNQLLDCQYSYPTIIKLLYDIRRTTKWDKDLGKRVNCTEILLPKEYIL